MPFFLPVFLYLHLLPSLTAFLFTDITTQVGIRQPGPTHKFGGPHIADLDGDGLYDLILTYHNGPRMQIYFANPNGTYTLSKFRTRTFDIHGITVARTTAYSKRRILSVSVGGGRGTLLRSAEIFLVTKERNFKDISKKFGFGIGKGRGRNAIFLDMAMRTRMQGYENGGGPDVFFSNYVGRVSKSLKQFGYQNIKGLFKFRSIGEYENEQRGRVAVTDIDGDGVMEIIAIRDLRIYRLQSPFFWKETTRRYLPAALQIPEISVTAVAEFDMDNDGDFDLYVCRARRSLVSRLQDLGHNMEKDIVLENVGGRYRIVPHAGLWGDSMGVTVGDFDNDGRVDVYVSKFSGSDVILRNLGGGKFSEHEAGTGSGVGHNAAAADLDLDGRVDVVVGRGDVKGKMGYYFVMRNVCGPTGDFCGGKWLLVRVGNEVGRGVTALHAVVKVKLSNGWVLVRRVGGRGAQAGGESFLDTVHFGIGQLSILRVSVRWGNGIVESREEVRPNSRLVFGRI